MNGKEVENKKIKLNKDGGIYQIEVQIWKKRLNVV